METFLVVRVRVLVVQSGMKPCSVVEAHIALDASAELRQGVLRFSYFKSPPEPLHAGVVPASVPTVHADFDAIRLEFIRELLAGELTAPESKISGSALSFSIMENCFVEEKTKRFCKIKKENNNYMSPLFLLCFISTYPSNKSKSSFLVILILVCEPCEKKIGLFIAYISVVV